MEKAYKAQISGSSSHCIAFASLSWYMIYVQSVCISQFPQVILMKPWSPIRGPLLFPIELKAEVSPSGSGKYRFQRIVHWDHMELQRAWCKHWMFVSVYGGGVNICLFLCAFVLLLSVYMSGLFGHK